MFLDQPPSRLAPPRHSEGSPVLPEDLEVIAIGDVHGHARAFEAVLKGVAEMPRTAERRHIILLGDLIDRGPDSRACLEIAMSAAEIADADTQSALAGNHELMLRSAIRDARAFAANGSRSLSMAMRSFLGNGGTAFLEQVLPDPSSGSPAEILLEFRQELGDATWSFLEGLQGHERHGQMLFVHAGIAPVKPLRFTLDLPWDSHMEANTHERHWAWIRNRFLSWQGGWRSSGGVPSPEAPADTLVVHGHTSINAGRMTGSHDVATDRIRSLSDRSASHGRICLDIGAARGLGIGCAQISPDGEMRFGWAPIDIDPDPGPGIF